MCALCGVIGGNPHLTDGKPRSGADSRGANTPARPRERRQRAPELAGAAVLINEFGEVGLDHHLLEVVDDNIVLLQSGCLCCTIRGDLAEAMRSLLSKRERGTIPAFDRLLVESTGLADPYPILSTIRADPVLCHHFRCGNVIVTVDAVNGRRQLGHHAESIRQVAAADRLVVTKTDLC